MSWWETSVKKMEELSANVGGHIFAVGWVKPQFLARFLLLLSLVCLEVHISICSLYPALL